jgi:hypothetical protein
MQATLSPGARNYGPVIALLVWGVFAAAVSATGVLTRLPFPAPLIGGTLTALLALSFAVFPSVREFARNVDLRAILALHLVRFVGFYFLYLYGQGRLPYAFAVPGGWGDNAAALGALILLALGLGRPGRHTRGLLLAAQVWNVFGLVDILGVIRYGRSVLAAKSERAGRTDALTARSAPDLYRAADYRLPFRYCGTPAKLWEGFTRR